MTDKKFILDHLRLLDDVLMVFVFDENIPAVELVLRILLQEQDLSIQCVETQKERRNLYGHSVRMDVVARDAAGRQFDLEVQREKERWMPQRLRYYSSMTDTRMLDSGRNYGDLQDSYTIFIMEDDIGKRGQPFYCFKRWDGTREMEDGSYLFYVNGEYEGDDPIGRLMHDFRCTRAEDMYYPELAERVKYLKDHTEGRHFMSSILDEWKKEIVEETRKENERAMREAEQEAVEKTSREIACRMIEEKELEDEKIAKYSGLPLEEVRKLSAQMTV